MVVVYDDNGLDETAVYVQAFSGDLDDFSLLFSSN